jgi:hypothetical protein
MITVACVLKLGGDFSREWVHALKRGLSRHLSDFTFAVLTDDTSVEPYWRIPLAYGWRGWWSKMEMVRPGLFEGPVLCLDLDTLPVGDLSDLARYRGEFALIGDLYRWKPGGKGPLQSGVMAYTPGPVSWALWERWIADPAGHMKRYRGDGEFIAANIGRADVLQTLYPGQIVSLKREAKQGPPTGARLVCGHGRPRMSSPAAGWAHREWQRLDTGQEEAA